MGKGERRESGTWKSQFLQRMPVQISGCLIFPTRNGIEATLPPGMTACDPSQGHHGAADSTVDFERLKRVARATGIETTSASTAGSAAKCMDQG